MDNRPELQPPALLIYLATAMAMLATAAMSPVLPAIQTSFGVSDARIGLVMSAFTVAVAVSVPIVGWLADRIGRRPVLGGSLLVFGIGGLGTYVAPDFTTILVMRALQGIGFAGTIPLVVTLVSDMFEGPTEIGAQGYRVTAVNLGGFLFPVATGALVAIAWNVPFLLFGMAIPVAFAVFRWLPEPTDEAEQPEGNYAGAVLAAARRPLVAAAVAVGSLRFFMLYALYAYLPLLIVERGLAPGQVGVVVGAIAAVKMLVATQSRRTLAAGEPRLVVIITLLVSLLTVGVFAAVTSFLGFVAVAIVLGIVEGMTAPLQKTVLTRYSPANVRAGIVSFNAAAQNVAKTLGPITFGLALAWVDLPTTFLLLGVGGAGITGVLLLTVFVLGAPAEATSETA